MIQKLLAIAIVVLGANLFFFKQPDPWFGSIGFVIGILLIHILAFGSFYSRKESRQQTYAIFAAFLSLCSAGFSLLRANAVDAFLLGSLSGALALVSLYLLSLQTNQFGSVSEVGFIPLRLTGAWFRAAGELLEKIPRALALIKNRVPSATLHTKENKQTFSAVIRGALITLPILLVIVGLLASADPVFGQVIKNLFNLKLPTIAISLPARAVFSLFVLAVVTPVAFFSIKRPFASPFVDKKYGEHVVELMVLVGAVAAVLGVFLLIQFRYLFLAVPDLALQAYGIATYSDYVRRGFVELSVVSAIVYGVAALGMVVIRTTTKNAAFLRKLNLLVLGESIVFIASIFRRILLYQAEHGLTRVRLYGTFFLIMMTALFIMMILRQFSTKRRQWYMYEFGILVATIFMASLINVDRLIATTFRPTVNKQVDYVYISRLSVDAREGWVTGYKEAKEAFTPALMKKASFTDAEARTIVYARDSISNIYWGYHNLAVKYGTKEDKEAWLLGYQRWPSLLQANLGEWREYNSLKKAINPQEIRILTDELEAAYNRLTPNQKHMLFDRSYRTPLVR